MPRYAQIEVIDFAVAIEILRRLRVLPSREGLIIGVTARDNLDFVIVAALLSLPDLRAGAQHFVVWVRRHK